MVENVDNMSPFVGEQNGGCAELGLDQHQEWENVGE